MRISGYGSGAGGGGRSRQDGAARRKDFRRRHRVGDVVRGRMLQPESEGLAWVEVDGQEMLAAVSASPASGARLLFLIRQLDPDIVLQEVPAGGGAGPGVEQLQRFWQTRSVLESLVAADFSVAETDDAAARERRFQAWLREEGERGTRYQQFRDAAAELNAVLQANGAGILESAPWLLPGAYGQERVVVTGKAMDQTFWAFTLPSAGDAEVRLYTPKRSGAGEVQASCRLLVERKSAAETVLAAVRPVLPHQESLSFQGISPLPPGPRGPLSRMLSGPLSGGGLPGSGFTARV